MRRFVIIPFHLRHKGLLSVAVDLLNINTKQTASESRRNERCWTREVRQELDPMLQGTLTTPIPTVDVLLVAGHSFQTVLLLCVLLPVPVSGEHVSAASFRSQEQPDHHPRDHSSHLWNDRNGAACYVIDR